MLRRSISEYSTTLNRHMHKLLQPQCKGSSASEAAARLPRVDLSGSQEVTCTYDRRSSQASRKGNAFSALCSFGCVSSFVPGCSFGHLASSLHRCRLRRDLALPQQGRSVLPRRNLGRRSQACRHLDLLSLLQTLLVLSRLVAGCHLCPDLCTVGLDILLRDLSQSEKRSTVLPGCDGRLSERGNVLQQVSSALRYAHS